MATTAKMTVGLQRMQKNGTNNSPIFTGGAMLTPAHRTYTITTGAVARAGGGVAAGFARPHGCGAGEQKREAICTQSVA